MLYRESLWFKKIIQQHLPEGGVVLNIGSSTKEFVEQTQPYIKKNLFDVMAAKGANIYNVDIKSAEGVDFVGDVTDAHFVEKLKTLQADLIICSNLLEHLENREVFCKALANLVVGRTKLIVSVPFSYPYHPDPIDTMYRPDPVELSKSFQQLTMSQSEVVDGGWFVLTKEVSKNMFAALWLVLKTAPAFLLASILANQSKADRMQWVFKRISATCAVFEQK